MPKDVCTTSLAECAAPHEVEQGRVATPNPYSARDASIVGAGLTPSELSRILRMRNQGYLQRWIDLADECREKDPHMHSQLAIREQSAVETEFVVLPGVGSNQRKAKRARDACEELMIHWLTAGDGDSDDCGGLERWIAEWVSSSFYGLSSHEVLWKKDSEVYPDSLELIDTRRFSYAAPIGDPNPWRLRLWDQDSIQTEYSKTWGVPVEELPADKILIARPRVRGSQVTREGLFSILVWYCMFRTWSWRDLMALCEVLGKPPILGYYAAGGARGSRENQMTGLRHASSEDVEAAKKAVHAMSGALRSVLPDTVRVETLQYQMPLNEPMQLMISREIDAMQSKAIHGVANLSDLKAGARAAVETQERTSYTFWRSDCRLVSRMMSRLFARYVRANPQRFGEDCPLPIVKARTESVAEYASTMDRIEKALKNGLRVPLKWAHEKTGIPEPLIVRGVEEPVLESAPVVVPIKTEPALDADPSETQSDAGQTDAPPETPSAPTTPPE